jgi:hypothetical protein
MIHLKSLKPGSRLWSIYKSHYWSYSRSIVCRLLMLSYSLYFIVKSAWKLNEYFLLINLFYIIFIVVDAFIVLRIRSGLEDRWCSFSLIFFICANTIPLCLFELNYGSFLSTNIFHSDFQQHHDTHYRHLNNHLLLKSGDHSTLDNSDTKWYSLLSADQLKSDLETYEVIIFFFF